MTSDQVAAEVSMAGEPVILATLVRGLRLLEAITSAEGHVTAKSLSRSLGLKPSTCYHLLRTLRAEGYVVRTRDGFWDVGPRASSLASRISKRSGPAPELSSILTWLRDRTDETVYLAGWFQEQISLQQSFEGNQALRVRMLDPGYTGNLHARASCQAMLAFLPQRQVEAMLSGTGLRPLTAMTIRTADGLLGRLAMVRRQGYAVDREEFADGICCVSAAFFDSAGRPAGSFTVATPRHRHEARDGALINAVRESAVLATRFLRTGTLPPPGRPLPAG
jgi:IclR family transcriptional regulator, acetate operon repressor